MNFAKKLSLIALSAVLFASCNDKSKDGTIENTDADSTAVDSTMQKETAANLETASFKIDGMTCPMGCAATIEKKLAALDGVENAKVDFENKTATVSFDTAQQTPETLVETVEKIADGAYKVSDVKSSGDKAFFSVEQEKEKKKGKEARKDKKSKKEADKKSGCGTEKKGGCCSESAKKSCGGHA
ncbi:heavy-metal-associated domain-containing protein [uncultured Flavobacterium sp.]|uniref:heavy-metal-associated domain-containing protein n=1 Tax=uncultured Flavobacterium sp. TaxID=165435 RepID=UPI0025EDC279|nr:heavy-metal-associated domain-containing protein [uncultured Flavobacterium sp.]